MRACNNYFLVLDIETSSLFQDEDGKNYPCAVWLSYAYCKLYNTAGETVSKCYFREWEELKDYFRSIQRQFFGYEIKCYVHNLAYEFDFLIKNISRPKEILSNTTHNIISSILLDFPNIQFCCTYMLSGYSLAKIGDMINFPKLESDYRTIYPYDSVTEEEKEYCERDCDIVAKYICQVCLQEFKILSNIPLTKTGRVRKTFNVFYNQLDKKKIEWDLMPPTNCYQAMCDAFQGGVVISNPLFTNIVLRVVHSYDIASSYPYVMLREQFPYTIRKQEMFSKEDLTYFKFWIAKIKFIDISSKFMWQWLSESKLQEFDKDTTEFYNGKVISSKYIVRTVTNIDFDLIEKTYDFKDYEILEFYPLEKYDYLPEPYINTIKHYSKRKYELKQKLSKIDENSAEYTEVEREYMLSKNDFNSIYGMTVQKLVQPEFTVDENYVWKEIDKPYLCNTKKHMKRNFLFGIYVTAYARRNLIYAILENCPYTFVYCDTDSIKFIGENKFKDTNAILQDEYLQIPSLAKLGRFEYEKTYEEFKTLGAKKYCYLLHGFHHLTVAGLPKKKSENGELVELVTDTDDFKCGIIFENCKLGKRYINNDTTFELDDDWNIINEQEMEVKEYLEENQINTNGGVGLFPTSYVLDMTKVDKHYITKLQKGIIEWVKRLSQKSGTPLTIWIDSIPLIQSLLANVQQEKHMQ